MNFPRCEKKTETNERTKKKIDKMYTGLNTKQQFFEIYVDEWNNDGGCGGIERGSTTVALIELCDILYST